MDRPRHKWLDEHRQLLCLFSKFYENSTEEIACIFNHLLADELKAEGFETGLKFGTIQWQLKSMQHGLAGYDIWRKVLVDISIREARHTFREDRDAIEDSALSLGIVLRLRTEEKDRLIPHGKRPSKKQRKKEDLGGVLDRWISSNDGSESELNSTGVLGCWISSNDGSESELDSTASRKRKSASIETPVTPTRQGRGQFTTPTSLQPGATKRTAPRGPPKIRSLPRLVFRWYNTMSQGLNTPTELRAGRFLNRSQKIPPPAWEREAVTNHLIPHKLPSPFISFRESCRPCIFRALKTGVDTNARITVVDLHKWKELSNQQWGHDEAIKACADLVEHFDLKLGKKGLYTGGGEWLVHGRIDKEAIVTTFRISDLIYYENRIPRLSRLLRLDLFRAAPTALILLFRLSQSPGEMNWHLGVALGSLLRNIGFPEEYWEEFASNFAESWVLRGWRGGKLNRRYEEYLKGVLHTDGQDIPSDIEDDATTTEEGDERRASAFFNNTIMAEQDAQADVIDADGEQALINAQLYAELAKSLSDNAAHKRPQSNTKDETLVRFNTRHTATRPPRFTRPRSSSLFTFSRPPIPGPATNWEEASDSRDVSPAPTEWSALDTFTTELLAKAEEVSTMGSFGRGPSTNRGVSEVTVGGRGPSTNRGVSDIPSVGRGEGEDGGVGRGERVGQGVQEWCTVIDLLSDDDDDGVDGGDDFSVIDLSAEDEDAAVDDDDDEESVEDLGLEIVGSQVVKA